VRAIDLFGGFGGFTLGAAMAGVPVVWAANHWELAVSTHAKNHPTAQHVCQDLRQADFTALPDFELLLASPACQGHSQAAQGNRRPKHDADRSTAWAVIDCAEATRPKAIIVENVLRLREWELYPVWKVALRKLGYHTTELVMTASKHGVPQRRTRLFVVATRRPAVNDLLPLHDAANRHAQEPAFGPSVDWSSGEWRPLDSASDDARSRFAAAQGNHGARCLSQHVTAHPGVPLDQPIRTITTKDQWCILDGELYRPLLLREYARGMGFPDSYELPEASREDVVRGLGNAVPPKLAHRVIERVKEIAA
jgi:DNA (cytosine-5)-methyltransferase 1